MQRERTQDTYPWTWEVPVGVGLVALLAIALSWQVARSVANWMTGAGWTWPTQTRLITSLAGLLQGDASAGLTHTGPVAAPMMLWIAMALCTVLTVALISTAGVYGWRRWGGGAMRGMASAAEAHRLLGAERLRHVRHIIRPDLYPPRRRGGLR